MTNTMKQTDYAAKIQSAVRHARADLADGDVNGVAETLGRIQYWAESADFPGNCDTDDGF